MVLKLRSRFGENLEVTHGVPVNHSTLNSETVRAWHNFMEWAMDKGTSTTLTAAMKQWLPSAENGLTQPQYTWRGLLPASMAGREMTSLPR